MRSVRPRSGPGREGGSFVLRHRRAGWAWAGLVAAAVAAATAGVAVAPLALAQAPAAKGKSAARNARARPRGNNPAPRKAPNAADPLVAPRQKDQGGARPGLAGSFHFRLKIHTADDTALTASYFPAKADTNSAVVLLVHEKERSSKDFEDPIDELKKVGMAEHLQTLGYAVLSFDLRGYGSNTRRAVSERDWVGMVDDLQSVYLFLVDRHNRGEINLAKLGVVAMGEGANLAAAWAYLPGGAVSHEGRVTDLAGLVLVSPMPEGSGYTLTTLMSALAPRIPVLLMAGERDASSHDAIKRVRAGVEKVRLNRVELFPTSLHGYKLLRLEPRATAVIDKFLEGTVKLKANDWEPRYNLTPVTYTDIQVVRHVKPVDNDRAPLGERENGKAKAAPKAKGKADDAGGGVP